VPAPGCGSSIDHPWSWKLAAEASQGRSPPACTSASTPRGRVPAGRVADSGTRVGPQRGTRSGLIHSPSRFTPSRSATSDSGVLGPAAERSRTMAAISSSSRRRSPSHASMRVMGIAANPKASTPTWNWCSSGPFSRSWVCSCRSGHPSSVGRWVGWRSWPWVSRSRGSAKRAVCFPRACRTRLRGGLSSPLLRGVPLDSPLSCFW
jgi:hypothetical protein